MRVILLSDPFSSHTVKWANAIQKRGVDVHIFGLSSYHADQYHPDIKIEIMEIPQFIKWRKDGSILKSIYLLALPKLKKQIRKLTPCILHAHSASSYGLLGALTSYQPFLISVWGNDVYNFPQKSFFLKQLLKYNLKKAEKIFSTSNIMAAETAKYTPKKIEVIPFGIDLDFFKPIKHREYFQDDDIIIGTIKSLEDKYGILELINAFKKLKEKYPELSLKLLLVGRGSLEQRVKGLISELSLSDDVIITGFITYDKVPKLHNTLDIMVNFSTEKSETFGVSVIEASACQKPVIVSNIGGLPEVVEDGITGFIIPTGNVDSLVDALEKLILDKNLRNKFGVAGRDRVRRLYNLEDNVSQLIDNYYYYWKKYFN